ncbi:starvation sensing protein RspA [Escherichia coli]|uniref:Starvation sensing protein RspA n=1 Tax=Escherichia coli TaxID=562 RepID=A0A376U0T6_ECOLX|nr:starvation sensing protein RspA [Escherichia coli]
MHPGDEPGWVFLSDEKLAAKYPYDPAYLPVARLEDAHCGTGNNGSLNYFLNSHQID